MIGINNLYRLAWRTLPHVPPRLGYALFHTGADAAWLLETMQRRPHGVGQLRRNLARLHEADTRAAMRSYMRYFYEAFALGGADEDAVIARVRPVMGAEFQDDLARGSVVVALPHMGNWDLVGAWASRLLAPVLTVAERLEPADLFEQFLHFRRRLGMHIIGQGRGERVFGQLLDQARDGHYIVALLADRDLSSSGIEVTLAGESARVAAGPAALAAALDLPLYVASIAYERLDGERRRRAHSSWGVVLTLTKVLRPGVAEDSVVSAWTQAWVSALEPDLVRHAVDWHMLQPVFTADLDPRRLARAQARHERTAATTRMSEDGPDPSGAAFAPASTDRGSRR